MNETSSGHAKLVSARWASGSSRLAERAQTARADLQLYLALALPKGNLLNIAEPAPLGVALRKAHIVPKLGPLAADIASACHAVHPLILADRILCCRPPGLNPHRQTARAGVRTQRKENSCLGVYCTMSNRFKQTPCSNAR